jgi:hypothetical protein
VTEEQAGEEHTRHRPEIEAAEAYAADQVTERDHDEDQQDRLGLEGMVNGLWHAETWIEGGNGLEFADSQRVKFEPSAGQIRDGRARPRTLRPVPPARYARGVRAHGKGAQPR